MIGESSISGSVQGIGGGNNGDGGEGDFGRNFRKVRGRGRDVDFSCLIAAAEGFDSFVFLHFCLPILPLGFMTRRLYGWAGRFSH